MIKEVALENLFLTELICLIIWIYTPKSKLYLLVLMGCMMLLSPIL